jgi:hypothetical protein
MPEVFTSAGIFAQGLSDGRIWVVLKFLVGWAASEILDGASQCSATNSHSVSSNASGTPEPESGQVALVDKTASPTLTAAETCKASPSPELKLAPTTPEGAELMW